MSFKNRKGDSSPPSGGYGLSRPVGGGGRLPPGTHQVEVLSVKQEDYRALLRCADRVTSEVHSGWYQSVPRDLQIGQHIEIVVDFVPGGFIVANDRGRYQARDLKRKPLGEWYPNPMDVYQEQSAKGVFPADVDIKELRYDDRTVKVRPYVRPTQEGEPDSETPDHGVERD